MTETPLPFDVPAKPNYRARVATYFAQRPRRWINGLALAGVGGVYAWRTRVSECRVQLGMQIDNRIRPVDGARVSEYRYTPQGDA